MALEPLTPENTTVVLVDYAVGFANLLRSHELSEHLNNVLGLAKTAKWYGSGLVVTNGEASKPTRRTGPGSWPSTSRPCRWPDAPSSPASPRASLSLPPPDWAPG